jgi:hypothetical protein
MLWHRPEALVAMGTPLRAIGVRRTVDIHWGGHRFVMKHFVEPSWRHGLKRLVISSRAQSAWKASFRLANAGIATPRAVACVENRWGPLRRDSYLVYPYIEGTTLKSYFSDPDAKDPSRVSSCWAQLCDLWKQLVSMRVTLGDANLRNFIVAPSGKLWVIDLDKIRFHRSHVFARRQQRIRWNQVLRSAAKC